MASFPIPGRSLPTGATVLPDVAIPVGTSKASVTLDITQMLPGQKVWMHVEYFDGANWSGMNADFVPGVNGKTGQPYATVTLNFDFGRPSQSGWTCRTTLTVDNGPFVTAGGTLVLT